MIFNVPNHIQYIRNGLSKRFINSHGVPARIVKTQTRRLNRGIYKVGKDYAVQRKRGATGELDIRIVIGRIWEEHYRAISGGQMITQKDAWSEGGYTPIEYEDLFYKLNPKFGGQTRWAFEFHVVEVYSKEEKETYRKSDAAQKELDKVEQQQKLERSLKHLHQEIIEHIHPYVTTKIEKVVR